MSIHKIVRAWSDPEYRASLSPDEVPEHPAGAIELSDADLSKVWGARSGNSFTCNTFNCVSTRGQSDHCSC